MITQKIELNDVTGPLLDAYRAMDGLLHENNRPDLASILSVLNQRLEQVLTTGSTHEC